MKKIIFFDVDRTLFDPGLFLKNFYDSLSQNFSLGNQVNERIQAIYEEVKNEKGYFIPKLFLKIINEEYPQCSLDKLNKTFWSIDLFEKSMYKDTPFIKKLASLATIGIFSKGDEEFQKYKLNFIKDLLDDKNVYIFPNKIAKIDEVFGKYSEYKTYFIDNEIEALEEVKKRFGDIITILIDRTNEYEDNKNIIKIKSFEELEGII